MSRREIAKYLRKKGARRALRIIRRAIRDGHDERYLEELMGNLMVAVARVACAMTIVEGHIHDVANPN